MTDEAVEGSLLTSREMRAASVLTAPRPSAMSPGEAAVHIGMLQGFREIVDDAIQARIFEACWIILRRCNAAEAEALFAAHTRLDMDAARRFAAAWEAARRDRDTMALASSRPGDLLRTVSGVVEAMAVDEVDDEAGREVARLAALPRKQRTAELRALVRARDAAREGRNPDDVERIEDLEALAKADEHPASAAKRDVLDPLVEVERALADILDAVARVRLAPSARRRLLSIADAAVGSLDRICELAAEAEAAA